MRRLARAAAALTAFFFLATPAPTVPPPGPGKASVARLFAEPILLDPDDPARLRLGPLRYLSGWALTSDDRRFGAISALAMDGERLLALSDQGLLFRFAPPPGDGRLEIMPVMAGPGDRASKIDRDGEAMAMAGTRLWIAYENSNQIWRYRAGDWRAEASAAPPAMRGWSANRGAETLVRLSDGRFLAIREDVDDQGVSDAILFAGDPAEAGAQATPLRIDPPDKFRVTDAAQLPDGRLLLLCRSFGPWSGWTARLLLAELPSQPGQLMPARQIAAFEAPLTRDNMEAIAVAEENGRTIVWLASDDNLSGLQSTLLLKFEIPGLHVPGGGAENP